MIKDVKVPPVGESVQEGMIQSWHKSSGDMVQIDDVICELETDKATVEITAPFSGKLAILKQAGAEVKIGDTIATIDESQKEAASSKNSSKQDQQEPASHTALSQASTLDPGPAVRHILANEPNISSASISASGKGGRLTKEDVILHLDKNISSDKAAVKQSPAASQQSAKNQTSSQQHLLPVGQGRTRAQERKPMSMLRRRIAERLIHSQQTAAILTTFNEVDMTSLQQLRDRYKDPFQERYGLKLGFMGFFLKASVAALQEFPAVNAYLDGTDICYHNYCDIGVAVSTEKGLVVPIIKDVDQMEIVHIEQAIASYAKKARENKIAIEDLSGGTFTVSNGGVFGSLLSTPIINPPQTAILGMHKIQQRPMVMPDKKIEARPMMYLALSYDHRLIDGKEAVGFLVKIKDCLEDPTRLLLGV